MKSVLCHLVIMLGNVAIIGGFIFLAVHFNHWWIVLLSPFCCFRYTDKN